MMGLGAAIRRAHRRWPCAPLAGLGRNGGTIPTQDHTKPAHYGAHRHWRALALSWSQAARQPRRALNFSAAGSVGLALAFAAPYVCADSPPVNEFESMTELPDNVVAALQTMQEHKKVAKEAVAAHDLPVAERAYLKALDSARLVDQMQTGGELNNLAEICRAQGKFEESARHLQEAIDIMTSVYGSDHGLVGFLTHNLGRVRKEQKTWGEARKAFESACQTRRETQEYPLLAESLLELSRTCTMLSDTVAATDAMRECVSVTETLSRKDIPGTAVIRRRMDLTKLLLKIQLPEEAEMMQRRGLMVLESRLAGTGGGIDGAASLADKKELNLARYTLAKTLALVGKHAEAAELFGQCLAWRVESVGQQHSSLRPVLMEWRASLVASGQNEKAEAIFRTHTLSPTSSQDAPKNSVIH